VSRELVKDDGGLLTAARATRRLERGNEGWTHFNEQGDDLARARSTHCDEL
jgi:hypothetical protein